MGDVPHLQDLLFAVPPGIRYYAKQKMFARSGAFIEVPVKQVGRVDGLSASLDGRPHPL